MKSQKESAFSLIEFVILIAILAILLAAVFIMIDPRKRIRDSRNIIRANDVASILIAVEAYQSKNGGALPGILDPENDNALADGEFAMIGTGTNSTACRDHSSPYVLLAELCDEAESPSLGSEEDDCVDFEVNGTAELGADLLSSNPLDPLLNSDTYTGYYIMRDENGIVSSGACNEEMGL